MEQNLGTLIVLTGQAGSGKDAIMRKLLEKYPEMTKVVTTTTRAPREGEENKIHHYFVDVPTFEKLKKEGGLLEWVLYSNNLYGTEAREIRKVLSGQDLIWRIEPTRAATVNELFDEKFDPQTAAALKKNTLVIYIDVENKEALKSRLLKRGMDEEAIRQRFKQDWNDWQKTRNKFSNIVVNKDGKLDQTVDQVIRLIEKHRSTLTPK